MPFHPAQRKLNSIIDSQINPELRCVAVDAPPGTGKSIWMLARAIHNGLHGREVIADESHPEENQYGRRTILVLADRLLRSELTKPFSKVIQLLQEDSLIGEPLRENFTLDEDLSIRDENGNVRIRIDVIYGKGEILHGGRLGVWMAQNPGISQFEVIFAHLQNALMFWKENVGRPSFRTNLESSPGWDEFIRSHENFNEVFLKPSEPYKEQFNRYVQCKERSYEERLKGIGHISIMTMHKALYGTSKLLWAKQTQAYMNAGEVIIDEAHEIISVGTAFTSNDLNLSEFCTRINEIAKKESKEEQGKAIKTLHSKVVKAMKAIRASAKDDQNAVVSISFKMKSVPTANPTKADLRFRAMNVAIAEMILAYEDLTEAQIGKIIAGMRNLPGPYFWQLFDHSQASGFAGIPFANFSRACKIIDGEVWMFLTSDSPGAAFIPFIAPRGKKHPYRKVILLSGTMFPLRRKPVYKNDHATYDRETFLRLIGLHRTETSRFVVRTERVEAAPIARYRSLYGNPLNKKSIFMEEAKEVDEFDEYLTYTRDGAIQSWANDIVELRQKGSLDRIGVLICSHSDGRRLTKALIQLGVNPSDIVTTMASDFIERIKKNPSAILLATKTNGYNLIETVEGKTRSLLTRLYLTRIPIPPLIIKEYAFRSFTAWTKTIQFLCRGARGDCPLWEIGIGDERFLNDKYFPSYLFQKENNYEER